VFSVRFATVWSGTSERQTNLHTSDSGLTPLFHAGQQSVAWPTVVWLHRRVIETLSHCRCYGRHRQYECQHGTSDQSNSAECWIADRCCFLV